MTYRDLLISSRIPAVRAVSKLRAMKRGWIPIPIYKNIHFFVSKSENLFRVMPGFLVAYHLQKSFALLPFLPAIMASSKKLCFYC